MLAAPKARRRWYQFGLGTIFVVMAVVAVLLTQQINYVKHRQAVKAAYREKGGQILAMSEWSDHPEMGLGPPPPNDVPLWRRWLGDEPVTHIWVITDDHGHPLGDEASLVGEVRNAFPEAATYYQKAGFFGRPVRSKQQ